MPERIERLGFIGAAILQIAAIIWWVSSLSSTVEAQRLAARSLDEKVDTLTERTIRIEERLKSFERDVDRTNRTLQLIEKHLNEDHL